MRSVGLGRSIFESPYEDDLTVGVVLASFQEVRVSSTRKAPRPVFTEQVCGKVSYPLSGADLKEEI